MTLSPAENRQKCHHKIAGPAEMAIVDKFIRVLFFNQLQSLPQQELPVCIKKIKSAKVAIRQKNSGIRNGQDEAEQVCRKIAHFAQTAIVQKFIPVLYTS